MASGRKTGRFVSDRTGFEYPYSEMVKDDGWAVHWTESDGQYSLKKHPQNNIKPKNPDPKPLRDARPIRPQNSSSLLLADTGPSKLTTNDDGFLFFTT